MNLTFTDQSGKVWTFLHVPKVAGKSVSAYITDHCKNAITLHSNSHATIKDMKSLNKNLGLTFALFRNPYSRAVSLYKFLFKSNIEEITLATVKHFKKEPKLEWHKNFIKEYGYLTFEDFCKNLPYMPLAIEQYHYLPVNKLFKIEDIDTEFVKFIQQILNCTTPFYKINSTINDNWVNYYNSTTRDLVYKVYKKDFKLLNYSNDINNSSI
jgi:hypothetical protein